MYAWEILFFTNVPIVKLQISSDDALVQFQNSAEFRKIPNYCSWVYEKNYYFFTKMEQFWSKSISPLHGYFLESGISACL